MSIIEEAVRKAAERRKRLALAADPMMSRPPRARRIASTAAVDAGTVRGFQTVQLDDETLAGNHLLPQLTDPAALRAYKILRTRLLRRLEANQWRSVAITGVTAGEGKTLTAINLAMALSQDVNTWVFLVDLDLQRPRIADYLGLNGLHGLSDYLVGDAAFESIIYSPNVERLSVVPSFQPITQASELLSSPRMGELLQALEAEHPRRIILFDMPPVLAADDVLAFAPHVDGVLLVVGEGTTGRDALKSAKEVLAEMNLLGVVLNRSNERNDGAYYSYAKT
ncbi:MAG TPA: CpsD/CapB family tyrosine-protein kinase [Steroidobacter sp.]|jgi:capsular exopolysaccharide synthesis family protein|nr:CpsD/CapB family tyrosine-protein kinase [Steroidobacter sp.]